MHLKRKRQYFKKTLLGLFVFSSLLLGCSQQQRSVEQNQVYVQLQGNAQGSTFTIKYSSNKDYSRAVDSILNAIDNSLSTYRKDSRISQLNIEGSAFMDSYFIENMLLSYTVNRQTNGVFNPAIGPLIAFWGFDSVMTKNPEQIDVSIIEQLLYQIQMEHFLFHFGEDSVMDVTQLESQQLELRDSIFVSKKIPEAQLNFNAIAQGYTVDVICSFIEAEGIENYMVELGGELKVKGLNPDGELWKIGIDKPVPNSDERLLIAAIPLNNKAAATSGSYRKYYESQNGVYSHTINPISGFPSANDLLSVTVIANSCALADAWATAFLIMGTEKAKELVARMEDMQVYLAFYGENNEIEFWHSPNLETIKFE